MDPDAMKLAIVIPLFYKGDKSIVNNYRPISLLFKFNKIFEKLICKNIVAFL